MKKIFCTFMSIIIIFSASGCVGTKQEVEKLGLVLATGIDITPENKYKLTVQILIPGSESSQSMSTSKNGKQISKNIMVLSSEGNTPYDALSNLSTDYGRSLFLGHIRYTVIGKNLAESGLYLLIDALIRGPQARPDNTLLLAKNNASDILEFYSLDEDIPANSVMNLIKLQSVRGYSPIVSRLDFANELSSKTAAPYLGIIDIDKDNNRGKTFMLSGTGVFKKDKLIGYLNMNETRGMQWIKGNVKNGDITTYSSDGKRITFLILNSKSKIKPIIENNNIKINITIKIESNIQDMEQELDPMKNHKIMDDLAKIESQAIEKEAKLALYTAQKKLNADIFDFGGLIHREYPSKWKNLQDDWDNIFPNVNVKVTVVSTVRSPGTISKPIK